MINRRRIKLTQQLIAEAVVLLMFALLLLVWALRWIFAPLLRTMGLLFGAQAFTCICGRKWWTYESPLLPCSNSACSTAHCFHKFTDQVGSKLSESQLYFLHLLTTRVLRSGKPPMHFYPFKLVLLEKQLGSKPLRCVKETWRVLCPNSCWSLVREPVFLL